MNTSESNEKLKNNHKLNISELHNLAIEEVYATNSSFKNQIQQSNNKELQNENLKLKQQIKKNKIILLQLKNKKINFNFEKISEKFVKKILEIENKVIQLKRKLDHNSLKESLNILEMNLGDDVIDQEKKKLIKKMELLKENNDIESKNNIQLRSNIIKLEEEITKLKQEVIEAKEDDKQLVTDKDLILQNKELIKKVEIFENKKKDADEQIKNIQVRFKAGYEKIKKMKEEIENLEENMATMSQTIENQRKDIQDKEKEIEEIKKGKDDDGNKIVINTEDYQKDLAMGNKENERINSLLEEQKMKNKELEYTIYKLKQEKLIAKENENASKVKLNIISQTKKTPSETKKNLDPVIEDPKITEFDTQGEVQSFSFRDIFKNNLHKKKSENENKPENLINPNNTSFGALKIKEEISEKSNESEEKSENKSKSKNSSNNPINQDPDEIEKKKNMTININNYTITNYTLQMVSPTSKNKIINTQKKPFSPIRTSKSLESNIISPKSKDFKSKLSSSFSIKSVEEKSEKESIKLEFKKKTSKNSGFQKMFIPSDMSESDSSITSCILKSPQNSNGDNAFGDKKKRQSIQEKNEELNLLKDPNLVKKNELGSTGNMILPNLRNSIKSVSEDLNAHKPKKMTKSLFGNELNNDFDENEVNIGTLANGKNSFNFEEKDKNNSEFSDSFEEDLFGNKKEMDSGVFSKRELANAFEEDEVLDQMMKNDVEPGETVAMFSQRIVAKTQEGADKNNNNFNKKPKKKIGKPLKFEDMTPEEKNLFEESFRNDSFAFASNNKEQSLLLVPQKGQILNTNLSFAADKNTFSSTTSFGTNQDIGNVLDIIREDSNRNEIKKKINKTMNKSNASDLKIVPEEDIEKDFEFNLPMKMKQTNNDILQFDSKGMGDFLLKPKGVNEKSDGNDLHQIMKDFNTGNMDQKIFDNALKHKNVKEIDLDESNNSPLPSPNGSNDEMFFDPKRFNGNSQENLEKDKKLL